MKSVKKALFNFIFIILLSQLSCNDKGVDPIIDDWDNLGLEGKLVNDLKLIDNYLYACAGKDGLYRLDLDQSNSQWEFLGLADTGVERSIEGGVTDVISVNGSLLVSYTAGYKHQHSGIYKSINKGITWFPSDSGMITNSEYPTTSQVMRLQQHPSNHNTVFAGTTVSLVYKSYDAGKSWKKVAGTINASALNFTIRFNPDFITEVWIGGESGRFAPYLLHSTDEGESWSDYIKFPENFGPYTYDNAVYDIAIDPTNENVIYLGMLGVIGKTNDKGKTFKRILGWEDGIYRHWRLEMNPSNPKEIFATGYYLYRTLNGGDSWEKIKPPFFEIYALAVNWQQRILYISVSSPENGIYKMRF